MYPKEILRDILALADLHRPSWAGTSAAITRSGVPTMDATAVVDSPRAALKEINAELADLRTARPDLEAKVEEARNAYIKASMPGDDSPEFKATEEAIKDRGEVLDKIEALDRKKILILESLGETNAAKPGKDGPAGEEPGKKGWNSSGLFTNPEAVKLLEYHASSKSHIGNVDLGQVIDRDSFAADLEGTADMRRGAFYGVIPQLRRRLRIVDLLPVAMMDLNTVPYTKESGSFTTAAGAKEGATKAEGAVTFTDAEAVARTIAHWVKLRKQSLADVPVLRGIIDGRLRYGVERKLEAEVLAGKGADPELEGILATTGLGVVKYTATTAGAATYTAEQVLRAITTIFLADAEATGLVMHPVDWQSALLSKSTYEASTGVTGGSGEFVGGGPFNITPTTLWGVPIVVSASMKENEILAGDFELGAQLFIREGVNVLLSDSDQDDFIKNRLTMLAEMRAALAVFRPAAFCKVWLTKAAEEAGN